MRVNGSDAAECASAASAAPAIVARTTLSRQRSWAVPRTPVPQRRAEFRCLGKGGGVSIGAMNARAVGFGAVAAAYERFRPGYPDAVVDEVLAYAGRQLRTALEIGAGTGKATRVFARRGLLVTATDPDAAMLAELRRHVPASVQVMQSAFEDIPPTRPYDLVFAAASLHWTQPENRWSRVAAMLDADGVFACFGGQVHLTDEAVEEAVHAARSPYLADDGIPSPDGTPEDSQLQWPGTELACSDRFVDVCQRTVRRRTTMTASDYTGYLSTVSAYLGLPLSVREHVLRMILRALPERVSVNADITLHLARRREASSGVQPALSRPVSPTR